jgi:hypothetical protein
MRSGAVIRSTADLNAEATKLLARLDRARGQLDRYWQRYTDGTEARVKASDNPYAVMDEQDELGQRVYTLRDSLGITRREVAASVRQKVPEAPQGRQPGQKWTDIDIAQAWLAFHDRAGRWPRKSDHTAANGLPDYKQLCRSMGKSPIRTMLDFVQQDTNEQVPSS